MREASERLVSRSTQQLEWEMHSPWNPGLQVSSALSFLLCSVWRRIAPTPVVEKLNQSRQRMYFPVKAEEVPNGSGQVLGKGRKSEL